MNERIKPNKMKKIQIVKKGLKEFCLETWPVSYYQWPLRIGIVFFRLLGTPGETKFEVIVPLYPEPASLELYRLDTIGVKGGSPLQDALKYALILMNESTRKIKQIKLIGDGGNDGPDPNPFAEEIGKSGILLDCIELSDSTSEIMKDIARASNGKYYQVRNTDEFLQTIKRED
jgi:Mg-chelatase subunit ChlD